MSQKNPVTQPGIDPGTVRLVAQHLNNYATSGPYFIRRENKLPTKQVTLRRIFLFHMLKVDKLVNKFPSFNDTCMFITVPTTIISSEPHRLASVRTYDEEYRNPI